MHILNIFAALSTAFGRVTFATVIWLYTKQLMAVHSQWLYWIWDTAIKSTYWKFLLFLVQTFDHSSWCQWQYCVVFLIIQFTVSTHYSYRQFLYFFSENFANFTAFHCNSCHFIQLCLTLLTTYLTAFNTDRYQHFFYYLRKFCRSY